MDLYTLNENFLADENVDQFISAIWTERYSSAGEVQLVLPATPDWVQKLSEGTYLALRGSREVMELKTQSIENDLLTVVGTTLVEFLNDRNAWFKTTLTSTPTAPNRIQDFIDATRTPGAFISNVVDKMVINPVPITAPNDPANLNWADEVIPYLTLGDIDTSGSVKRLTIPTGPLYEAIQPVAEKEGVGISLYLHSADPTTGYSLKFTTYRGKDRTSTQSTYPLIRLSPDMDTLSGLKEVRSIAGYKNVAYVYYRGIISTHYLDPLSPAEGLDRRTLIVDAAGDPSTFTPEDDWVSPGDITAFREQNARDALANHNYIRAIDGETSPQNDYKYGIDYGLGDILELQGFTGILTRARVTEYIRSQDKIGEREYPTISVVAS